MSSNTDPWGITRDELGRVLCHHGRPLACDECANDEVQEARSRESESAKRANPNLPKQSVGDQGALIEQLEKWLRPEIEAKANVYTDGWNAALREVLSALRSAVPHQPAPDDPVEIACEALLFAQGAILDAIGLEDGLDGHAGAAVIKMIRLALKANGREPDPFPAELDYQGVQIKLDESAEAHQPAPDALRELLDEMRVRAAEHRQFAGVPCQSESTWHADEIDGWTQRLEAALLSAGGASAVPQPPHSKDCAVWRGVSPHPESEPLPCDCGAAVPHQPAPDALREPKNWLIYDTRSECYWGPNRGGYFKSIADAGLYTEAEAKDAQRFAETYGRREVARPLEEHREAIERLYAALLSAGGASAVPQPQGWQP
jgi:hypothetical protein